VAAPTSVTVVVDDTEYSRYEETKNTITATVTISGGAPYTDEPITVELRKARRSRDAIAATSLLEYNGASDPQSATVTFYLPDLVDQDLISLVRYGKYFVRADHAATAATAVIGGGANGAVTLTTEEGAAGNSFSIEVVVPAGTAPLTLSRLGNAITVDLAVSAGVPITADNQAIDIRDAINAAYTDVTATMSGTGLDSLTSAEGPTTFTGGTDDIIAESGDFDIRIVTVERLKKDYLFGIPLTSTNVKLPKFEPQVVTGVTYSEVSSNHPEGFGTLSFSYTENDTVNATAAIGSGADGTVTVTADAGGYTGAAGNDLTIEVVVPGGTSALSAVLVGSNLTISLDVTGGVPNGGANTATLVATAIDALTEFSAVASGTGATALSVAEGPTAFTGGLTDTIRTLSWRGGPVVPVSLPGTYILRAGTSGPAAKLTGDNASQDFVCVRVRSVVALPTSSIAEEILITTQALTDETLGRYIDQAIDWVEKDFLAIYIEPTNVVTDRDPTTVQFAAGINAPTPIFTDTDFDFLVSPLTYFVPKSKGQWVQIWAPYRQILRVDSLFGAIANTRVIDIDLEWIEQSEQGGLIQLVPFNQEIAFDFVGLIWVNAIRGAAELPNFWHFNMIVGLRDADGDLQELLAKKAAIEALQAAALAFRPGLGSLSLSRDGVSESVSYNSQQQFGIYTGTILAYREWIKENEQMFRAKYRGLDWMVV
jgi:hypothetical protein